MNRIILKRNEERRINAGHQWIFSNEIQEISGKPLNGEVVEVISQSSNFLCKAFYNKNSLISLRVLTKDKNEEIDFEFFKKKIIQAEELRKSVSYKNNSYRLVNGESDFLPGLIIDKYVNKFGIQVYCYGMEIFIEMICKVLIEIFDIELIVLKNDFELRILEGLEKYEKIYFQKNENSHLPFIIELDNIKYKVNLIEGQKTGFYLDQVQNRINIRKYINKDSCVLDLFCNEGGFSLNAAFAGAKEIVAVDSSLSSVITAKENAALNNFNNINFLVADIFEFLNSNDMKTDKFNFVVLDPPSFTKSKKNIESAKKGYIKLNSAVMKSMKQSSFLYTFCCSHHIDNKLFEEIIHKSAVLSGRKVQILDISYSSYDHPLLIEMAETKYLQGYLLRIL